MRYCVWPHGKKTQIQCACQSLDFSPVGLVKCESEGLTSRWSLLNLITSKTVQCRTHSRYALKCNSTFPPWISHTQNWFRKETSYYEIFIFLSCFVYCAALWLTDADFTQMLFSSLSETFNALLPSGKKTCWYFRVTQMGVWKGQREGHGLSFGKQKLILATLWVNIFKLNELHVQLFILVE